MSKVFGGLEEKSLSVHIGILQKSIMLRREDDDVIGSIHPVAEASTSGPRTNGLLPAMDDGVTSLPAGNLRRVRSKSVLIPSTVSRPLVRQNTIQRGSLQSDIITSGDRARVCLKKVSRVTTKSVVSGGGTAGHHSSLHSIIHGRQVS